MGFCKGEEKGATGKLLNLIPLRFLPDINPDSNKALINSLCALTKILKYMIRIWAKPIYGRWTVPELKLNHTVQNIFTVLTIWLKVPVWDSQRIKFFFLFTKWKNMVARKPTFCCVYDLWREEKMLRNFSLTPHCRMSQWKSCHLLVHKVDII